MQPKPEKATAVGSVAPIKVSTKVTNALVPAGLTQDEITHIEQGVRENGFDAVYQAEKNAGASPERLSALQDAYGVKKAEDQFLTTDYLSSYYGDTQLKDDADKAGYRHLLT